MDYNCTHNLMGMLIPKKVIYYILALILAIGLIWFVKYEIVNSIPSDPVIVFPGVKDRVVLKKDFEKDSVAFEIKQFMAEGAEKKTLWRLEYADVDLTRILGLHTVYELDVSKNSMPTLYNEQLSVAKNNGWKLLAANMEGNEAFMDLERENPGANYKVRFVVEQKGQLLEVNTQYLITKN